MRTDYFADLLPEFVTAVTAPPARAVTPESNQHTLRNNELGALSPTVTGVTAVTAKKQDTGKQTVTAHHGRAVNVYEYRLTDKPGTWLTLIADCDLTEAARTCRMMFDAKRVLEVREKGGCIQPLRDHKGTILAGTNSDRGK